MRARERWHVARKIEAPMRCHGFQDNAKRKKHYKKHVLGKGGGTGWVADMSGWYASAESYERAAITFATAEGTFHAYDFPIVELQTAKGNVARWNQNTGMFAAATPSGQLITFHMRLNAELFQRAIVEF
jgi:hypothetical protein